MLKVLLIVAVVMLTIYCVVELAQAKGARVRAMPRWLWLFVVICVPVIGPFAWLLAGRPSSRPRPRQLAPDDDEDFLRGLH
ncbi:PLD nuclease N-terminal domain-containing protein [[Pseudopropionibacterium] massiliense]|uniref:PLD nuclease N-terminal domain-containing protein n=1 Tax=[Pseudopropionibacterium] massiliense TaxID=2220000 RepID=UPI00102F91B3|nr:PLD nuclease N-terminal domain-containing protein [[Pseudopropionibacterium] massiliense]